MKNRHPTLSSSSALLRALLLAASLAAAALPAHAQGDPKAARFYEDALVRFEKKDHAGAVVQLKNALQIDKKMLPVHVLLGKALLAQGDVIAAEVAFTEALRLGVNRAEVVVPMSRALINQGKPQEVLTGPRFAVAGLPAGTQFDLYLLRAAAATDLGDPRTALQEVESARALDQADPGSWLAEVPIRVRTRQPKEALAAADKAISLAPNSADAQYARGEALHVVGDLKNALVAYDKTILLAPGHVDALIARAGALLDLGRTADAGRDISELLRVAPGDPRGKYMAAVVAEREGKPAQAKAALNEVTALLDPIPLEFLRYRPQILMLGGMAHHGLNQGEKAKPYLEAVLRTQPGHPVSKVLANIYLADKNVDRAIEALDGYLRGSPSDVQAMLQLAAAHMSQGRHARATQLMQDALKLSDQPQLRTTLGLSLVGRGKFADALTELEAVVAKDPGQLQAGYTLSALYLNGGQAKKAVLVAEGLAKKHAGNTGVHQLLGSARRQAGDAAGARAAFDQALKLDPAFVPAQISLARLDIDARANEAAAARLAALLVKDPRNVDVLLASAEAAEASKLLPKAQRFLETADDFSGPTNLSPAIALVDFHLRHQQVEAAREAVKRANNKNPEAVSTLLATARVALAAGDGTGARAPLTRAANVSNGNPPLMTRIALMQLQAGHVAGAAYSIDKALAERPDYLPALALRSDLDIRLGEPAKAEQRARQLIAKYPKQALGHGMLGDAALARGQRDAAIDAYRRAHELDQSSDSLLRLFRSSYGRDPAASVRLAEQWVKSHPRDAQVLRGLADSQLVSGNLAAARSHYEALIKLTPGDGDALNNLAYVMVQQKDPGALAVAERALAQSPNAAHIIGTTGWAAFKAGQPDRAMQLLRDARLRDPANADTRYFLGEVLVSIGRPGEAREELSNAVKTQGSFTNRQAAQQLLATLR